MRMKIKLRHNYSFDVPIYMANSQASDKDGHSVQPQCCEQSNVWESRPSLLLIIGALI